MQLGIFSRTYRPDGVDTIFARIAQDGFQAIQFNFSSAGLPSLPPDWPGAASDEVKASAARRDLTICALSGTYNMAHPDAAQRLEVGAQHALHEGRPRLGEPDVEHDA